MRKISLEAREGGAGVGEWEMNREWDVRKTVNNDTNNHLL